MYIEELECCGIRELNDISDNRNTPEETILKIAKDRFYEGGRYAFVIFSDIAKKTAGTNLQKYIIKNNLGKVIKTDSKISPSSENSLAVWTWSINQAQLKKFWNKNKKNDEDYDEEDDW